MFLLMMILNIYIPNVELKLLVHTAVGSIQGVPADDGDYVMFLGIPYAKVNASNPFGASTPYPKFKNVFKANDDTVMCPQLSSCKNKTVCGVIDCLQINVYVPNTGNYNKSVFIYIHGGRNSEGYKGKSFYGPKYLVRHDIIVVTLNYRLGPYGFLCTEHSEVPGNQGLKDQYLAIKWVSDNIQAFGGNPQNMTIGGHSSGSMCVDTHLLTKHPRLFQQAILQSGPATYSRFTQSPNTTMLLNMSERLGLKTNDVPAAVNFLAKLDPELVLKSSNVLLWRACIENKFEKIFRFIEEHPEVSEAKNVDDMNILGGFTDREFIIFIYEMPLYKDTLNKPDIVHNNVRLKFYLENVDKITKIIKQFYSDGQTFDTELSSLTTVNIDFLSDFTMVYPMQKTLMKYSKHKNTKIYQYMFSYNGFRNLCKKTYHVMNESGAGHCDDLGYMFTNLEYNPEDPNEEDEITINRMTTLWTNFIKYGNPTPKTTELIPVTWPLLTAETSSSLQIDRNLSVISHPFRKSMAFWDLFYEANFYKVKVQFTGKSTASKLMVKSCNIEFFIMTILVVGIATT